MKWRAFLLTEGEKKFFSALSFNPRQMKFNKFVSFQLHFLFFGCSIAKARKKFFSLEGLLNVPLFQSFAVNKWMKNYAENDKDSSDKLLSLWEREKAAQDS
jgi:hypothetical protein